MSDARNQSFVNLLNSILNNDLEDANLYIDSSNYVYFTGWTALHWACDKKSSYSIIDRLIHVNPKAASKKTYKYGRTPLHILAINRVQDEKIMQLIIQASPSSNKICTFLKDNDGNNPLHLALKHFCPINIIKIIVNSYPVTARMKNKEGMLPIEIFFITWYPIIRNFLDHDLHQKPEPILKKKSIRLMNWHGSFTIKEFCDITFYLLHLNILDSNTTTATSLLSEDYTNEPPKRFFLSPFSNPGYGSCPWTFYELFIQLYMTHIGSIVQNFAKVLITLCISQNSDFYRYQLRCKFCNYVSSYFSNNNNKTANKINKNYITISRDCDLCYSCGDCRNNEGNISSKAFDRVIPIDESAEQIQAIYTLLRDNPSIFITATKKQQNKNDKCLLKRGSKPSKINRTIQICSNTVSRKSFTIIKRGGTLKRHQYLCS